MHGTDVVAASFRNWLYNRTFTAFRVECEGRNRGCLVDPRRSLPGGFREGLERASFATTWFSDDFQICSERDGTVRLALRREANSLKCWLAADDDLAFKPPGSSVPSLPP